jgi:hypothetical protein
MVRWALLDAFAPKSQFELITASDIAQSALVCVGTIAVQAATIAFATDIFCSIFRLWVHLRRALSQALPGLFHSNGELRIAFDATSLIALQTIIFTSFAGARTIRARLVWSSVGSVA